MGAEMPRILFPAILAIGLFAVAATQAEERRGFRVPIGVPGLSGGETIQKVLDLPDVAVLKRSDGKYVDLGYLHIRWRRGRVDRLHRLLANISSARRI